MKFSSILPLLVACLCKTASTATTALRLPPRALRGAEPELEAPEASEAPEAPSPGPRLAGPLHTVEGLVACGRLAALVLLLVLCIVSKRYPWVLESVQQRFSKARPEDDFRKQSQRLRRLSDALWDKAAPHRGKDKPMPPDSKVLRSLVEAHMGAGGAKAVVLDLAFVSGGTAFDKDKLYELMRVLSYVKESEEQNGE